MARKRDAHPDTLDELASLADRAREWIEANPLKLLALLGAVLLAAAVASAVVVHQSRQREAAARALAEAEAEFRVAMGGEPDATEVPEPANPETARRAREAYLARLEEILAEHGGAAGAVAALRAGDVAEELGDRERALALFEQGRDRAPRGSPLRALLEERRAVLLEDLGRLEEASRAHEAAAEVEAFPLRYRALADAARTALKAGDPERARTLYERVRNEAPDLELPPHVREPLEELLVAGASPPEPGAGAP